MQASSHLPSMVPIPSQKKNVLLLSGKLPGASSTFFFSEKRIVGDGSCGFHALKATRKQVVDILLLSLENEENRRFLYSEVAETLEDGGIFNDIASASWHSLYKQKYQHQDELDAFIRYCRGAYIMPEKLPREILAQWLDESNFVGDAAQLRGLFAKMDQIEEQMQAYCARKDLLTVYVKKYSRTVWLGCKSMVLYAKQTGNSIYIWQKAKNSSTQLELVYSHHANTDKPPIHTLLTDESKHFNSLVVQPSPALEIENNVTNEKLSSAHTENQALADLVQASATTEVNNAGASIPAEEDLLNSLRRRLSESEEARQKLENELTIKREQLREILAALANSQVQLQTKDQEINKLNDALKHKNNSAEREEQANLNNVDEPQAKRVRVESESLSGINVSMQASSSQSGVIADLPEHHAVSVPADLFAQFQKVAASGDLQRIRVLWQDKNLHRHFESLSFAESLVSFKMYVRSAPDFACYLLTYNNKFSDSLYLMPAKDLFDIFQYICMQENLLRLKSLLLNFLARDTRNKVMIYFHHELPLAEREKMQKILFLFSSKSYIYPIVQDSKNRPINNDDWKIFELACEQKNTRFIAMALKTMAFIEYIVCKPTPKLLSIFQRLVLPYGIQSANTLIAGGLVGYLFTLSPEKQLDNLMQALIHHAEEATIRLLLLDKNKTLSNYIQSDRISIGIKKQLNSLLLNSLGQRIYSAVIHSSLCSGFYSSDTQSSVSVAPISSANNLAGSSGDVVPSNDLESLKKHCKKRNVTELNKFVRNSNCLQSIYALPMPEQIALLKEYVFPSHYGEAIIGILVKNAKLKSYIYLLPIEEQFELLKYAIYSQRTSGVACLLQNKKLRIYFHHDAPEDQRLALQHSKLHTHFGPDVRAILTNSTLAGVGVVTKRKSNDMAIDTVLAKKSRLNSASSPLVISDSSTDRLNNSSSNAYSPKLSSYLPSVSSSAEVSSNLQSNRVSSLDCLFDEAQQASDRSLSSIPSSSLPLLSTSSNNYSMFSPRVQAVSGASVNGNGSQNQLLESTYGLLNEMEESIARNNSFFN
jgi:hypothetical protein